MLSKRPRVFVLSSPSGGGKTTLGRKILSQVPALVRSISMTTRSPRPGEKNGRDYFFVKPGMFGRILKRNGFLESAVLYGFSYGTPKAFVEKALRSGKDALLLIDVQGALKVRRRCPSAVLIFIMPPSLKELKTRLVNRSTESALALEQRLRVARWEIAQSGRYDYRVENRDLNKAFVELKAIITAERLRVMHGNGKR